MKFTSNSDNENPHELCCSCLVGLLLIFNAKPGICCGFVKGALLDS